MAGMRAAELEVLFTADARQFDQTAQRIDAELRRLDGSVVRIDVQADTTRASAALQNLRSEAGGVPDVRIDVRADTSGAQNDLDSITDSAASSGEGGGKAFMGGLLAGLASIPVVGAITGLAGDIGQAFSDAFAAEVNQDMLIARTGISPDAAKIYGRAAGEAYADNFGSSVEENLDTARLALQSGLLDPAATEKDSQAIIESLSGVASILGEEVAPVVRTTTQLLHTGLASSAQEAFDIIVRGQQAGLNVSEDWLDTLDEYSIKFKGLGLTGTTSMGLLSQAVRAGARDTDSAADALKEFAIRAVDGSATTAQGFAAIGLSASDMAARISAGGESASSALGETLNRLRAIEDPAARSAAAVALFGTKAEDLGNALFAMDLNTAAEQLGTVAGAAQSAIDTMGDNAAGSIASAQRNIELATDGIKAALASAFNPQIEQFADYVSHNREQIMQFLVDIADAGFDAWKGFLTGTADVVDAIGSFAGETIPTFLDVLNSLVQNLGHMGLVTDEAAQQFADFTDSAKVSLGDFQDSAADTAETMRTDLVDGVEQTQAAFDDFTGPLVAQAAIHDATTKMAEDIDSVGYAADGASLSFLSLSGDLDTTTEAGAAVAAQIESVVASMHDQAAASMQAGESAADLTSRLDEGRSALIEQMVSLGMTREKAVALADAYGAVPDQVRTEVAADIGPALANVDSFIARTASRTVTLKVFAQGSGTFSVQGTSLKLNATGGVLHPMAAGGVTGTLLDPIAQMVPPGTMRIVGDRMDVPEAYIPLDGSARSRSILAEAAALMPMASGGIVSGAPGAITLSDAQIDRLASAMARAAAGMTWSAMEEAGRRASLVARMRGA